MILMLKTVMRSMSAILSLLILGLFLTSCWGSKRETFEDLTAAYRDSHSKKSISELLSLFKKSKSFEDQRASFEISFGEDIQRPIRAIDWVPLDNSELSYELNGKIYRPVIAPAGRMKVSFDVENDITASTYLVGLHEGEWFILSAEAQ
jgi:hypothetical protein